MTAWTRVRAMPAREIAFRVRGLLRANVQRARVRTFGTRWDRRALRRTLHPALLGPGLRRTLDLEEWPAVEAALRERLQARPSRFVLEPGRAASLRQQVLARFPTAAREAACDADGILANRYDLLGYRQLSFSGAGVSVDWHADPVHGRRAPLRFWADVPYLDPACGDHKVIWELNRHQHFLRLGRALWLTGDRRYAARVVSELESWLEANPPLQGINWSSMLELGLRSLSWIAAMHFLLADEHAGAITADRPWLVDMCLALDRQLEHVAGNLSLYFSPNTHLTGEALALYTAGLALPELARAARWTSLGRSVLLREIERQICADGGHIERSTHYHRYTLDFYTLALLMAERAGDTAAAAAFRDGVSRLAPVMRALADDEGRIPLIGDDDGGMLWPIAGRDPRDVRDSLGLAALLLGRPDLSPWPLPEEVHWLAAPLAATWKIPEAVTDAAGDLLVRTQAFTDTGIIAIRTAQRDHLLLDAGPHGFRNGGHAHADALSVTLAVGGRPLLIDPGTATYTMDAELRDRMRSSQLHNTLTLDGRSSSEPKGPFHWKTAADARLDAVRGNGGFACVHARHTGFAPATHHRSIVFGDDGWLVIDRVESPLAHRAETFWHFDPAWEVAIVGHDTMVADAPGARVWLVSDAVQMTLTRGDEAGLGWCSPRYGSLVPAWTARTASELAGGGAVVTWIGAGEQRPVLERLRETAGASVAVSVRRGNAVTCTVVRETAVPSDTVADRYRTDAQLLQWSCISEHPWRMALAEGAYAVPLHGGPLAVRADRPMRDLHIAVANGRLEICSTDPPGRLQITCAPPAHAVTLTLNGRELAIEPAADGTVTVLGTDWAAPHRVDGADAGGTAGERQSITGGRGSRDPLPADTTPVRVG